MKILIVSPWYPWPPFDGGRIRVLETMRYLSRHHQVTLLATVMSADEADDGGRLQEICHHVETSVLSPGAWPVARRLAKGLLGRMPVIQNFYHDPRLAERLRRLTSRRYDDDSDRVLLRRFVCPRRRPQSGCEDSAFTA